jgi:O-antigen ligase
VKGQRDIFFTHAHNVFLNAMVRSGVFGLLAAIGLFAVPLALAARAPKDATGRAGFALMACVCVAYLVNGAVNISFGHDILDAVYIYTTIAFCYLVFGPSSRSRADVLSNESRTATAQAPAGTV